VSTPGRCRTRTSNYFEVEVLVLFVVLFVVVFVLLDVAAGMIFPSALTLTRSVFVPSLTLTR
jgi:hypothetical protein